MIPCAKDCKYQQEGCCMLESAAAVKNTAGECPHFEAKNLNKTNGFANGSNINQFH